MKKTLLLLGLILLLTSCDDDSSYINQQEIINLEGVERTSLQSTSLIDMSYEDQLEAFINNAEPYTLFSDFIKSDHSSKSYSRFYSRGGLIITPCNVDFEFSQVTLETIWDIEINNGDHTTNTYTDFHLEQIFRSNWRFNFDWYVKPSPLEIAWVQDAVAYVDFGYENVMTGEIEYLYLDDSVSIESSEYILQEIACQIKQYMESNYPNKAWTDIYDVNLIADWILGPENRLGKLIRAEFKVGEFQYL